MSIVNAVTGSMEYTEGQQDRFEPTAGQAIPYEDYSGIGAATTEEEETQERDMKHPKPSHQQKQQRPSRKRSLSSSSSDSSRSSSSSSVLSSSDGSSSDSDTRVAAPKKKKRKKKAAGSAHQQKPKKGQQQNHRRGDTTETTTTDDGSINKLISVALRSQKKQYKNQIIESVKSDLMNTLRSRIVQHQQRGKKKKSGNDDEEGGGEDIDATDTGGGGGGVDSVDKQYRKRIKQAYKEHEEGYDDAPKFNSKQHKKTIGSILSKIGEVNDIELFRIPHIDKEMGLDRMDIGGGGNGRDSKLTKKMLSASPEKTIPEAVYAALKDAYSSCMLYKYFFRRIYPYLTVPYISK